MIKKIFNKIQYVIVFGFLCLPFTTYAVPMDSVTLDNPLRGVNSLPELINKIIDVVILLATPLAILAIIYSGFLFVKAQGNSKGLEDAKNTLLWTIIGIAVLLGANILSDILSGTVKGLL
ncbi:MAG: hypothetical protein V1851_03245 [Patescibacteria group bacterium]